MCDVERLISTGENEEIEFKENFDFNGIVETAVAFANKRGGVILVGVRNNGTVVGVQTGRETLRDWANRISQNTDPPIIPELEVEDINGKKVLCIKIDEYPIKPVMFRGRAYMRVGSSNKRLNAREIAELYYRSIRHSWDYITISAGLEEINSEAVREFVEVAKNRGRLNVLEGEDLETILEKLELVRDGKPTRALILLFGNDPQKYFPHALVRIAKFRGSEIEDEITIDGNLFNQVEEALKFIRKHINIRFKIGEKAQREELWDYPPEALREAVINAIAHRDYAEPDEIQIKIFNDRIIFWNPGGLPFELKIEDLYRPHPSRPRNKLIAKVFYYFGYIEKWGSGIERILRALREYNLPEPKFEEVFGGFQVTFYKDIYTEEHLRELGLNDRQIRAVLYVKEKGSITNKEYQELCKVSRITATRDLSELVEKGILMRVGRGKRGIKYVIQMMQK
ncbi:DeoR family transcriptional regulator [Thermococcus sp. MV5]|uniref:AlbA family DNA-binding domain-containing protein n=1 Tax=Thermococcus sp. MV5 TaxID=1638272 RepID=UPI00143BF82B|nr:helix-turn-helix domain-containing protein [Thermococcus sp. MV5]NJE26459.1 DeoR family transcriptional regulator [Thermococcus sp. MV5]